MKDLIFSIILIGVFSVCSNALPTVAICGFDGSGSTSGAGDEFSFVLLKDMSAGEVIYFTEDEYSLTTSAFFSGEGHLAYTVPAGGLLENDVVRIRETGVDVFTVQCSSGTATIVAGSGAWSFSGSDELYAYSASNPSAPWSSVTEIHSFYYGSVIAPPADQNPTPDWPNTIKVAPNFGSGSAPNTDFIDAFRVDTTIPMLQNTANWTTSSSDITLSCTDFTNQMLPIELVSFDARLQKNQVVLDWVTASEINNERFEVEHSKDGKNFNVIGIEAGRGTSNEFNSYQMIHTTPHIGLNYYRLKQVDFDGAYSYSDVVVESYRSNGTMRSVYPNPFNQEITLTFSDSDESFFNESRTVQIYDVNGRLVLSTPIFTKNASTTLDLSVLKSGIYFLKTLDEESTSNMERIIKI